MGTAPRRYRRDAQGDLHLVVTVNGVDGFEVRFTDSCWGCFEPGECDGMIHYYKYDRKAQMPRRIRVRRVRLHGEAAPRRMGAVPGGANEPDRASAGDPECRRR